MFGPRKRPPPGITPEHESRAGHQRAGVEAPAHPPERIRGHVEVEAGHATRRAEHAGQFAQRRRWIGHVTQQVRERDGVERRCRKRKLLGARALQLDPAVQAGGLNTLPTCLEHRLADVDTDDLSASRPSERDRHTGRAGGRIENATRLHAGDVPDQLVTPPGVLAQGKDLGQAVVPRGQVFEEMRREGVLGAHGRRAGICHGRLQRSFSSECRLGPSSRPPNPSSRRGCAN